MSNWANEAFVTSDHGEHVTLRPGEYAHMNPTDIETVMIASTEIGKANGYEPPRFPLDIITNVTESLNGNPAKFNSVLRAVVNMDDDDLGRVQQVINQIAYERKIDDIYASVRNMDPGIPRYEPQPGR